MESARDYGLEEPVASWRPNLWTAAEIQHWEVVEAVAQ